MTSNAARLRSRENGGLSVHNGAVDQEVLKLLKGRIRRDDPPRVLVISDTHFDHESRIHRYRRPFGSVAEMNRAMLGRWNAAVREEDTVCFGGDLVAGQASRGSAYWLERLNGNIIFIEGNKDKDAPEGAKGFHTVKVGGREFYMVHDPAHAPADLGEGVWIIYGHKHNLSHFPFVNGRARMINMSADVIGFRPVPLDAIAALPLERIMVWPTINDKPEMFEARRR
ncbi:MAG: metallophosphoesterase family protein [Candidatus Micrarchaeota archaeon]|nr:metallophosphoesterase family protein [Candidatus Micrarchaeota archaeon]